MPNFMAERPDSPVLDRRPEGETATLRFNLYGNTDQYVLHALLIQEAPGLVNTTSGAQLVPSSFRLVAQMDDYAVGEVFYVDPTRQRPAPTPTNGTELSFAITAETLHVEKSLATTVKLADDNYGTQVPDFKRAIGVTEDGIEGTDIVAPKFTFNITRYVPLATVTDAWVHSVADLVGTVANHTFRTFPAGEVLLMGVSGATRSATDAELTFEFARNKNETLQLPGLLVQSSAHGDPVQQPEFTKLGWEHLWIRYDQTKDAQAKRVIRRARFAFVERVYPFANWSILNL